MHISDWSMIRYLQCIIWLALLNLSFLYFEIPAVSITNRWYFSGDNSKYWIVNWLRTSELPKVKGLNLKSNKYSLEPISLLVSFHPYLYLFHFKIQTWIFFAWRLMYHKLCILCVCVWFILSLIYKY